MHSHFEKQTQKKYHQMHIKRNSFNKKQILIKSTSEKTISEMPHKQNNISMKHSSQGNPVPETNHSEMQHKQNEISMKSSFHETPVPRKYFPHAI